VSAYQSLGYDTAEAFASQVWESRYGGPDANNFLNQLWTWLHADIGAAARFGGNVERVLRAIEARTFVLPVERDPCFPAEDAAWEAARLPRAELRVIRSIWGHFVLTGLESPPAQISSAKLSGRYWLNSHWLKVGRCRVHRHHPLHILGWLVPRLRAAPTAVMTDPTTGPNPSVPSEMQSRVEVSARLPQIGRSGYRSDEPRPRMLPDSFRSYRCIEECRIWPRLLQRRSVYSCLQPEFPLHLIKCYPSVGRPPHRRGFGSGAWEVSGRRPAKGVAPSLITRRISCSIVGGMGASTPLGQGARLAVNRGPDLDIPQPSKGQR
jgi:hypothetical protein